MRWGVFAVAPKDRDRIADVARRGEGYSARFGDKVFVWSATAKWSAVSRDAAKPLAEGDVRDGRLHLVRQKGRLFQQAHPDVPVLLDAGRFLVVDLERKKVEAIGAHDEPCFSVETLGDQRIVFDLLPPPALRAAEPGTTEIASAVSSSALGADLGTLVAFPTRLSTSDHFDAAAAWAVGKLAGLGLAVETVPVDMGSQGESANVVASKPGNGVSRQRVIVCGHLDSVNHDGGPAAPAPGADDNGSGSAGVLEIARVLAPLSFAHDLAFVLFGGEEQGLFGSRSFVDALPQDERARIRAVINMDMIGSRNTPQPTVLLEGAPLSQSVIDALAAAAGVHTSLAVQTSLNPFASDHVPFIEAGIPAVLTIEGADSANDAIHSANDTLEKVDTGFAAEIVRMNATTVATLAGLQPAVVEPAPGCGCCGPPAAADAPSSIRQGLAGHVHQLLAQYARLHGEGRLRPEDVEAWRALKRLEAKVK